MTYKERMLAVLAGEPTDNIPWVPRLDIWFRANTLAGTLPAGLPHDSLLDLVDALDWGMHAVIPDFRDLHSQEDDIDRGLGIFNLQCMPYRTELADVERIVRVDGDVTHVTYHTPVGSVSTTVLYDDNMRRGGVSLSHIAEPVIKGADDFPAVGYIFSHARVLPNYAGYSSYAENIGDRGIAVGFVCLAGSPMQLIMREMIPLDQFFFLMYDEPEAMAQLVEEIDCYWQRVLKIAVDSPAEVLLVGGNYDASVTYPPFYKAHIEPWLQQYADALHARGKYLLTHTDGENTGLLPHYLTSRIDIADSICPSPMTRLTMGDVRKVFGSEITIMGGIPSVALLQSSLSDEEFTRFLDDFFRQIGHGDHLILGISDTTPPAADFDRLRMIVDRIAAFGSGKVKGVLYG